MKNIEKPNPQADDTAQSILVMPSSPPDGDSLGQRRAIYLALRQKSAKPPLWSVRPGAGCLQFLPMINTITDEFTPLPDFIITVNGS